MRQPGQPAERLVDGDDDAVLIREPHAVHGIFPDGTEQRLGAAQRHLRRAPLGQVADVKQQRRPALELDARHADFHRHHAAVRAQAFALDPRNLAGRQLGKFRARGLAAGGRNQILQRIFADQLRPLQPVQPARAHVHVQHIARQVLDENSVRRIFKQLAEPALAVAQLLLHPHPLQRAAALVGQRLKRLQIPLRVAVRTPALDEHHADDASAFADRGEHRGAGLVLCFRRRDQFRAARDRAPHQHVGGLGLGQGGNFHPPLLEGRDGQQRNHFIRLRQIQVEREIVPAEQFIRRVADELGRPVRRGDRAQMLAQAAEHVVLVEGAAADRDIRRHGERGKPALKHQRRPDDLHVHLAAMLAPVTPD